MQVAYRPPQFLCTKTISVLGTRSGKWDKPYMSIVAGPCARSTKWGRPCLGSVTDLDSRPYFSHVAYLYSKPRIWKSATSIELLIYKVGS